jgi:flagellar biosynthesis/type III secretory pathway protein FliH
VTLGIEVARSILRVELPRERYDLEPVIRECLALGTEGRGAAEVHLNPADAERLADIPLRSGTRLVPDAGVGRAEVRVESPLGVVVREPDACLARAREALLEELSR